MVEITNSIRKYNYWNGNSVASGYRRMLYTDKIGQFTGNNVYYTINMNYKSKE